MKSFDVLNGEFLENIGTALEHPPNCKLFEIGLCQLSENFLNFHTVNRYTNCTKSCIGTMHRVGDSDCKSFESLTI